MGANSLDETRLLDTLRPIVECLVKALDGETLGIDVDLMDSDVEEGEDGEDSGVGRGLDEDVVAGSDEGVEGLKRKEQVSNEWARSLRELAMTRGRKA